MADIRVTPGMANATPPTASSIIPQAAATVLPSASPPWTIFSQLPSFFTRKLIDCPSTHSSAAWQISRSLVFSGADRTTFRPERSRASPSAEANRVTAAPCSMGRDSVPTTTPSKIQITLLRRFIDFLYSRLPLWRCICTLSKDNQARSGDSHQPLTIVAPCRSCFLLWTVRAEGFSFGASA